MFVFDSFESTYLGKLSADGRSEPRFSPIYWNFFADIIDGIDFPRTTNNVEGFHRGFEDRFTGSHPSIVVFCNAIKQQQRLTDFELTRLDHSIPIGLGSSNKKAKIEFEEILSAHLHKYSSMSIENYISGLLEIIGVHNVNTGLEHTSSEVV